MIGITRAAVVIAAATQALPPPYAAAQTTLLEVADNDAPDGVKILQVNADGGLVARVGQASGVIPASGAGIRLMWYPRKHAFRAGRALGTEWDDANVGFGSFAAGEEAAALGESSAAMGRGSRATGSGSTATGEETTASGGRSTAMGYQTIASGQGSTALGRETQATGDQSIAMGFKSTAAGGRSTAMGSNARALGLGSFAYGDASSDAIVAATANMFAVRAAGGFRFRTSPNQSTGCDLQSGSGTFNCTSSRLAKEDFTDLDGEVVLDKLAAMRIQRWRYRGTDNFHAGPTAEDFHAAFRLGAGPTTISTVDADGISLIAVQALERRTAELREENAALRAQDTALRAELDELRRMVESGRVAR